MEPFKLLKSKEELSPERSKSKGELRSRAEGTDELSLGVFSVTFKMNVTNVDNLLCF